VRLEEEELREQPVSASGVRVTRCGECQSRLTRDFFGACAVLLRRRSIRKQPRLTTETRRRGEKQTRK